MSNDVHNIFSFDVLPAGQGDCLIIHFGPRENTELVVIDGGPGGVYASFLEPRLAKIKEHKKIPKDKPLTIKLLMVSHIDDDHIQGILDLTNELVGAVDQQQPQPFKIRNFWHNTFDDMLGSKPLDELVGKVKASFGTASLSGETDVEGLDPVSAKVLASVNQGRALRDNINRLIDERLTRTINADFSGVENQPRLIVTTPDRMKVNTGNRLEFKVGDKTVDTVKLENGLNFTVVGPMKEELSKLQKEHDDFLKEKGLATDKIKASFTDTSIPNLSSLVLLVEFEQKRILLTGDARGDKILEGLQLKDDETIHLDILKMPHHGSDRNMTEEFLKRITADHYVFSGNGENGNPERTTLEWLWSARGDADYKVHLTYPLATIDENRKKDWETERKKEIKRREKKPDTEVREEWSAEKHSLTSLFEKEENKAFKDKLVIAETEGEPHVIDLLDTLGF